MALPTIGIYVDMRMVGWRIDTVAVVLLSLVFVKLVRKSYGPVEHLEKNSTCCFLNFALMRQPKTPFFTGPLIQCGLRITNYVLTLRVIDNNHPNKMMFMHKDRLLLHQWLLSDEVCTQLLNQL